MHVGIQMGDKGVHNPPPPPAPTSVLSILMHGVISLTDTTSYDNVLFAEVGVVV